MKLHYMGKYSGNPEDLPIGEHQPGAVKFKEPESARKLAVVASAIGLVLMAITWAGLILRGGVYAWNHWGIFLVVISLFPHEMLHSICFKKDVYLYTNLKQGMLFVVGPETMSKGRFIFMSLLPNICFGFIPYVLFLFFPQLSVLGTFGAFSIPMGAGDYLNVYNALTQMPRGSRTYLYGFNSYWYIPGEG